MPARGTALAYDKPSTTVDVMPRPADSSGAKLISPEWKRCPISVCSFLSPAGSPLPTCRCLSGSTLKPLSPGERWQVRVGMRHWHPFIKETLAEMEADYQAEDADVEAIAIPAIYRITYRTLVSDISQGG